MSLAFDMALSETYFGSIGVAAGEFTIELGAGQGIDLWGAAILTTDFSFLEEYGIFTSASGLLLINTTNVDQSSDYPSKSRWG